MASRAVAAWLNMLAGQLLSGVGHMTDLDHHQRQNDTGNGLAFSPPYYPSTWMDPEAEGWEQAYAQAREFVGELTLLEKVNLTTGVG